MCLIYKTHSNMTLIEEIKLAQELGLTAEFVISAKIEALPKIDWSNPYQSPREKISSFKKELSNWNNFLSYFHNRYLNDEKYRELWIEDINECYEEIRKLKRKILMIKNNLSLPSNNSYNIAEIKRIPIDTLVEVNRAGFFKVRDEKTPSCKWYKDKNTWHDFGSGEGGDVIDLYRLINKCDVLTALKALSVSI